MIEAALWGALATSALLVGAEAAFTGRLNRMAIGLVMAFGVGALIASVSFELIAPAAESSSTQRVVLGLAVGSLVFFAGDFAIERLARSEDGEKSSLGLVLGAFLDGIPEGAVLGMSLVVGGEISVALLVGVWISNFPESLAATVGMEREGWTRSSIRRVWFAIVIATAVAAAIGFLAVDRSSTLTGAFVQAFAAGALLTMIADELMPEAYERSSIYAGLATTAGFTVAALLAGLE